MNPQVAQWAVEAVARLLLTFAILIGIGILIGGDIRFSGPNYVLAMKFPGAPESWAIAAILPGVTGLLASLADKMRLVAWSLFAVATWAIFFTYSLLHAVLTTPTAGTTAVVVHGTIAIACLLIGVVHRAEAD